MIGNNLRKILNDKKIDSKDFAKMIKVSPTYVSYLLNNKRNPSFELLDKICEILSIQMSELFKSLPEKFDKTMDGKIIRDEIEACENADKILKPIGTNIIEVLNKSSDVKEAMDIILSQPGLMLNGKLLSDESKLALANAIKMGLAYADQQEKKDKSKEK